MENKNFALDLVGKKKNPVEWYYFFIWFLITDSACYLKKNPITVQPLTRYSIYRGMWFVCFYGISISRESHAKIMRKSDKKLHIGISCKRVFMLFAWNLVSLLCDFFFAYCSCNLLFVSNSYYFFAIFAWIL